MTPNSRRPSKAAHLRRAPRSGDRAETVLGLLSCNQRPPRIRRRATTPWQRSLPRVKNPKPPRGGRQFPAGLDPQQQRLSGRTAPPRAHPAGLAPRHTGKRGSRPRKPASPHCTPDPDTRIRRSLGLAQQPTPPAPLRARRHNWGHRAHRQSHPSAAWLATNTQLAGRDLPPRPWPPARACKTRAGRSSTPPRGCPARPRARP